MSEAKRKKQETKTPPVGGELSQEQLAQATGGMIDVQSAVANFVQGGALPKKKK